MFFFLFFLTGNDPHDTFNENHKIHGTSFVYPLTILFNNGFFPELEELTFHDEVCTFMLKEILVNLPLTIKNLHFDFMSIEIAKTFYMYLSSNIQRVTFIDFDEFFEDVIHPHSRSEIFELFQELRHMDLVKDFAQVYAEY